MRKPRVLIYDDDTIILEMLDTFFSKKGYEVYLYSTPVVCPYESLADSCDTFYPCADLVLSDFKMPKMTGLELFQRQSKRGCKVDSKMKAIMSGYSDEEILTQCKDLGYSFFRKPFTFSELSEWLTECEKHFDLSQPLGVKRVSRRYSFIQDIEYRLNPAASKKIFVGSTVDKSIDGLGLRIFNPLRAGDTITIIKGFEATQLNGTVGTVMWCSQEGETIYRAGLRLLNS